MDDPPEEDKPEHDGEKKLHHRHQEPPLEQLTEPGNEKAAERRDDVAGGTLTCHEKTFSTRTSKAQLATA